MNNKLRKAKRFLEEHPTQYEGKFRGVPLHYFTAEELIKILGIAVAHATNYVPSSIQLKQ